MDRASLIFFYIIAKVQDTAKEKMRSAQAPFGTWAIMKKFIYVCKCYTTFRLNYYRLSILP